MGNITRTFANNILSGGVFDATDLDGAIPASNIADASVTNITAVPALVTTTTVASDPPSPDAGQIWYNTTDKVLRGYVLGAGSWASGGALNTARYAAAGSFGSQTANILAGGAAATTSVEEYNGTSWSEIAEMNTARKAGAGFGTTTAGIVAGGEPSGNTAAVESWNGSAWTEVNDIPATTRQLGGFGTSTSGLVGGGKAPTDSVTDNAATWDGTNWTDVAELGQSRAGMGCAGTSSSNGVFAGGESGPPGSTYSNTETWDGSSWTETTEINTARAYLGASNSGTSTDMIIYGGATAPSIPVLANTESWDGSTWTESNDLSTARRNPGLGGTSSAALAAGGYTPSPGPLTNTEEWTKTEVVTTLGAS